MRKGFIMAPGLSKSDEIELVIKEMKENEQLWNIHNANPTIRRKHIAKAAQRTKIPFQRFFDLVTYVKRQFARVHKIVKQQNMVKAYDEEKTRWKWYEQCMFLKDHCELNKTNGHIMLNGLNHFHNPIKEDESHQSSSTSFDPIAQEDEPTVVEEQPTTSHQQSDQSDNEVHEDSETEASDETPDEERKFIINSICSSVKFHLNNGGFSNEELIEFHSDIIKFMYSDYKKMKK